MQVYKFCEAHPVLEYLDVGFRSSPNASSYAVLFKLLKLKFLSYWCSDISKGDVYIDISPFLKESTYYWIYLFTELVEAMNEAYPNLEILQLSMNRNKTIPRNHETCLSALSFPMLTSLTLSRFDLRDGSFLLSVNITLVDHFSIYLRHIIHS